MQQVNVVLGIFAACVATAVVFTIGESVLRVLGKTGANVMMRLMGLIMMLIAVEFFFAGVLYYVKVIAAAM